MGQRRKFDASNAYNCCGKCVSAVQGGRTPMVIIYIITSEKKSSRGESLICNRIFCVPNRVSGISPYAD